MLCRIGEGVLHQPENGCLHRGRQALLFPSGLESCTNFRFFFIVMNVFTESRNQSKIVKCHRPEIENNFAHLFQAGTHLTLQVYYFVLDHLKFLLNKHPFHNFRPKN
ncbi:hypothetical protein D3C80_1931440 [compost metagenome]